VPELLRGCNNLGVLFVPAPGGIFVIQSRAAAVICSLLIESAACAGLDNSMPTPLSNPNTKVKTDSKTPGLAPITFLHVLLFCITPSLLPLLFSSYKPQATTPLALPPVGALYCLVIRKLSNKSREILK
jgi:hypothetical protein